MFKATFEEEKGDLLLGGMPDPEHDSNENIISVFINKVIDPDKPFGSTVSSVCVVCVCELCVCVVCVCVCVSSVCVCVCESSVCVWCVCVCVSTVCVCVCV